MPDEPERKMKNRDEGTSRFPDMHALLVSVHPALPAVILIISRTLLALVPLLTLLVLLIICHMRYLLASCEAH